MKDNCELMKWYLIINCINICIVHMNYVHCNCIQSSCQLEVIVFDHMQSKKRVLEVKYAENATIVSVGFKFIPSDFV